VTGWGVIPNGRKILVAGMTLALLGALYAPPALAAACGQVLALSGSAVIATGAQQRPAAVGDSVQTGDTISVPQDSKARLLMNDGSIVTIAAGTQMTIDKYDVNSEGARQDAKLTMDKGLLRAVVSVGGGTPNFEVKTATGVAAVRGTEYYVDAQRDTTQVYVVSGNVSLTDAGGRSPVLIPPMSASSVEARKEPTQIRPVTSLELSALAERTAFHLGLCQCVDPQSGILARCRPNVAACEAYCGSAHYSFVPLAPASCGLP
jgi:hypothetical protein